MSWADRVRTVDAAALFPGRTLLAAPHMDDEVIGCGATLARLSAAGDPHVVFATDGSESPKPPGLARVPRPVGLAAIREEEAVRAAAALGLTRERVHFLRLPDGRLSRVTDELVGQLSPLVERLQPDTLLVPFRMDRHPDHVALNRAARRLVKQLSSPPRVVEYFVYFRWKLLPGGDVRAYLRPGALARVEAEPFCGAKRAALECHESQVTRYYAWQHRPMLTPDFIRTTAEEPEFYLLGTNGAEAPAPYAAPAGVLAAVHALEPRLKRTKDAAIALAQAFVPRRGSPG